MNQINSIRNNVSYYDSKNSTPAKQGLNSIPAATVFNHSGMNALSSYNQASVSFEGFGFFQKLSDKIKTKKENIVEKHQQKKEERLQKKEEKLQQKLAKTSTETVLVKSQEIIAAPKAEEVKKAEEAPKAAEAPRTEKKPTKELDVKFFEGTPDIQCLITTDKETGTITYTRYNEEGSIKSVQEIEVDGTDTYTTFYDKEGKMPMESFIDLPDGKHRYIKYRKNGTIKVVAELKEDNKTLTSLSRYHYKEGTDKLESIRTIFEDRSATREWFKEDGTLECKQFEKNGRVSQIQWYYEDGETVRLTHAPQENGGLERCVYDREGRLLLSDITKPDKRTSEEITNYYYNGDSKNYSRTITTYDTNKGIETWYNDQEVATCSVYSEDGKKTKTKWFFEDGETTKIEELYLADGRTQKVTMDKDGRWLEFTEFSADKASSKVTKYIYEGNSEVPHSSITTHTDGTVEKVWYDDKENMSSRRTTVKGIITKLEWFHEGGEKPKIVRTYSPDGKYVDEVFDKDGNPVKEDNSVSA